MVLKLNQLASIKTGLVLSRKKANQQSKFNKKYKVISLKSFYENGYYEHSFADDFIADEEIKDENILQKGDILVRLREPNIAVYIDEYYENTIISSLAAIVRVNKNKINPLFLANYLNSSFTKKQLYSQGTAISMLNIKSLGDIEIILPKIEVQEKVAQLQALSLKEIMLLENLIEEKQKYSTSIFEKIIKQETKND